MSASSSIDCALGSRTVACSPRKRSPSSRKPGGPVASWTMSEISPTMSAMIASTTAITMMITHVMIRMSSVRLSADDESSRNAGYVTSGAAGETTWRMASAPASSSVRW